MVERHIVNYKWLFHIIGHLWCLNINPMADLHLSKIPHPICILIKTKWHIFSIIRKEMAIISSSLDVSQDFLTTTMLASNVGDYINLFGTLLNNKHLNICLFNRSNSWLNFNILWHQLILIPCLRRVVHPLPFGLW